ncbi:nuclear transport factor 2 family protein [Nocardia sp. NPDC023988]|uniref:nuclear transport factor 2 family protein n=1 Tax=unclassified Nocardia TaxID=2637762 RepID=UPI00340FE73A
MTESNTLADTLAITETITRMFVYCDQKRWDGLVTEVFTDEVDFDGGFGGGVSIRSAEDIAADWKAGLDSLDAVHHQSGNHLIDIHGDEATAHADSIAVHVNNSATNGKTRTFIGSYALAARRTAAGWRISKFHYLLKVIEGNADLT